MTDALRVDPQALEQAAAFADGLANSLIDQQRSVAGHMAELMDSGWHGCGADACGSAWQMWTDGFRRIMAGLADETMALRLAASDYRASDVHGSNNISDAGSQV